MYMRKKNRYLTVISRYDDAKTAPESVQFVFGATAIQSTEFCAMTALYHSALSFGVRLWVL